MIVVRRSSERHYEKRGRREVWTTFRSRNGQSPVDGYRAGVGVQSMQERAAELGGTLSIQAGATGGTQVIAEFPVQFEHG